MWADLRFFQENEIKKTEKSREKIQPQAVVMTEVELRQMPPQIVWVQKEEWELLKQQLYPSEILESTATVQISFNDSISRIIFRSTLKLRPLVMQPLMILFIWKKTTHLSAQYVDRLIQNS